MPRLIYPLILIVLLAAPIRAEIPRRVVSMAPNLTESVFAIGAQDKLVGVTSLCVYPEATASIRKCGGWSDPNFEVIAALEPDMILIQGQHQAVRDFAEPRGIEVCSILMDDLDSIREGMKQLGQVLGVEDGATSAVKRLDLDLDELRRKTESLAKRPRVFLSLARSPGDLAGVMTVSGGSFMDEALRIAGGENIFADIDDFYPQVSRESLIARRPELILEVRGDATVAEDLKQRLREDWQKLRSIPAVRENRIELVTGDFMLIPGPRFPQIVRGLQEAMQSQAARAPIRSKD